MEHQPSYPRFLSTPRNLYVRKYSIVTGVSPFFECGQRCIATVHPADLVLLVAGCVPSPVLTSLVVPSSRRLVSSSLLSNTANHLISSSRSYLYRMPSGRAGSDVYPKKFKAVPFKSFVITAPSSPVSYKLSIRSYMYTFICLYS